MKAITICQPYAELIARGEKTIENRTWETRYRGTLAIHAGKSRAWLDPDSLKRYPDMPFGAIVAVADLWACFRVESMSVQMQQDPHAHGPWCWMLRNIRRLETPVVVKGAQGLWEFEGRIGA